MGIYVRQNAVDVLCFDDWENVPLLKKWHDGTWTFADFWSLQIQHRPVIPRVIVIALAFLGDGDNRWPQYFSFGLSALISVLFVLLLRRTIGPSSRWLKPLAFAGNCLIFSPILFQNFFWSTLFWMSMPVPCMIAVLLVLHARWGLAVRFIAALLLAAAATFSFTHGLVIWPVLGCYLLLQPEIGKLKARVGLAALTAMAACVVFAAYFHDFRNQAAHAYELGAGDSALKGMVNLSNGDHVSRVIRSAAGLVGNGIARSAFDGPQLVRRAEQAGTIILIGAACCGIACVFSAAGRATWRRTLPWLALAAYGAGMALAVAIGRAHLGEHRCTIPRYFVGTMFVTIAVMVTSFILLREAIRRSSQPACWNQRARLFGVGALVAFVSFQWPLWQYGLHLAGVWNNARHQAKALLMFINYPELMPWSINSLDNSGAFTREQVRTLADLGLLRVQLATSPTVDDFKKTTTLTVGRADADSIERHGDEWIIRGHARFGPERPADMVLITAEDQRTVIALGVPRARPLLRLYSVDYEFANVLEVPVEETTLWEARIPTARLPGATKSLYLWALDSKNRRVAPFQRKIPINR